MEYLKKDIFYPSDGNYDSDLMDQQRDKYENYLISVKEKLPKALWKAYESYNRFHDFWISSFTVFGMAQYTHAKSDVVRLSLNRQETELYLEFSEIYYLKVLNENRDSCWVSVAMEDNANTGVTPEPAMLEEALLCEIGLVDDVLFKFELLTASASSIEIHFKKLKVKTLHKRKIYILD